MFLLRVTLTVMGGVALAIVIAVLIGYMQPAPDRVAMLHLDMCQPPCWIGITPGITKLDEAERRIKDVFLESQYEFVDRSGEEEFVYLIRSLEADQTLRVSIGGVDSVVKQISLSPQPAVENKLLLTIAELNAIWGSPHYISIYACDGYWRPYYNIAVDSYIVILPSHSGLLSPDTELSWDSNVLTIQVFVGGQTLSDRSDYHVWQGYVSYRRYGYDESNFGACAMP